MHEVITLPSVHKSFSAPGPIPSPVELGIAAFTPPRPGFLYDVKSLLLRFPLTIGLNYWVTSSMPQFPPTMTVGLTVDFNANGYAEVSQTDTILIPLTTYQTPGPPTGIGWQLVQDFTFDPVASLGSSPTLYPNSNPQMRASIDFGTYNNGDPYGGELEWSYDFGRRPKNPPPLPPETPYDDLGITFQIGYNIRADR